MRLPTAWNVPPQIRRVSICTRSSTRESIARAALFVNVRRRIRVGSTPSSTSRDTRKVSARVFPLPAPAMTRIGPSGAITTSSCSRFSSAS
jgi:hypothetical protein